MGPVGTPARVVTSGRTPSVSGTRTPERSGWRAPRHPPPPSNVASAQAAANAASALGASAEVDPPWTIATPNHRATAEARCASARRLLDPEPRRRGPARGDRSRPPQRRWRSFPARRWRTPRQALRGGRRRPHGGRVFAVGNADPPHPRRLRPTGSPSWSARTRSPRSIVAGVLLVITIVLLLYGRSKLSAATLEPSHTIRSVERRRPDVLSHPQH